MTAGTVNNVFVYGTLKPGFGNHAWIEDYVLRSTDATVRGQLFATQFGFPAALFDPAAEDTFKGTIVTIKPDELDKALAAMDQLEGEGHMYERVLVNATVEVGGMAVGETACWSYQWLMARNGFRRIDEWAEFDHRTAIVLEMAFEHLGLKPDEAQSIGNQLATELQRMGYSIDRSA